MFTAKAGTEPPGLDLSALIRQNEQLMPLFSIVVVHYQGTVSRETYLRGVNSILGQTFTDYEALVYHDGPLLDPEAPTPYPFRCTAERHNDWGHSLRDRGIREATGDYILHFNADNLLYPFCLQTLVDVMHEPDRIFDAFGRGMDNPELLIFPIVMHDHVMFMNKFFFVGAGSGARIIMTGNPPGPNAIDAMQLVMRREIWLSEGGWSDKSRDSDATLYSNFARKYGYRGVGVVLGEHF